MSFSSVRRLGVSVRKWIVSCRFLCCCVGCGQTRKSKTSKSTPSSKKPCANCSSSLGIVFSTFWATVRLLQNESRVVSRAIMFGQMCTSVQPAQSRPNGPQDDVNDQRQQAAWNLVRAHPVLHRQPVSEDGHVDQKRRGEVLYDARHLNLVC